MEAWNDTKRDWL